MGKFFIVLISALLFADFILIYSKKNGISLLRQTPERLSNGDDNIINIQITNHYNFTVSCEIIDEIPAVFQIRDFKIITKLWKGENKNLSYILHPVQRGEYEFGSLNCYLSGPIQFLNRRFCIGNNTAVSVYPSFIQMRKFELLAHSNRLAEYGIKKKRSAGRHSDFDQIRKYSADDDFRTINWKATARKAELMVNLFQEEKSQQVYCIIDMGRVMKMPFQGMTLLDYAINASLAISGIAIYKEDKAGLICFSSKMNAIVKAERKNNQMLQIMEALYNQVTDFSESNYELLFSTINHKITQRSLLLIYTNFESIFALERQLKYLKLLSRKHVVLVIFFVNTEIEKLVQSHALSIEDIYITAIAEKMLLEKKQIVKTLQKHGIYSLQTEPENLTVNTINKYLEIKSNGVI